MPRCKAGQSKSPQRRHRSQTKQHHLMLLKRSETMKALLRTIQPRANSLVERASLELGGVNGRRGRWRLEIMRYAHTDYGWRVAARRQSYRTTEDGGAFATRGQLLSD
jgi:hypothetical protein